MNTECIEDAQPAIEPIRFSLRQLFAFTWVVAAGVGSLVHGQATLMFLGLPAGILGWQFIVQPKRAFARLRRPSRKSLWCLVATIVWMGFVIYGQVPVNAAAWALIIGMPTWHVSLIALDKSGAAPLVMFFGFCLPYVGSNGALLMDLKRGCRGRQVSGMVFSSPGVNTGYLNERLGYVAPHFVRRMQLHGPGEDGEKVASRSLIFDERLPEMLAMLPDEAAEIQVLECLTDPTNHLRAHQNFLLALVYDLGYPPGHDSQSWWKRHKRLFYSESDASAAAQLTWGWFERARLCVASPPGDLLQRHLRVMEKIGTSEDREFTEALFNLEMHWGVFDPTRKIPVRDGMGLQHIDWWPDNTPPATVHPRRDSQSRPLVGPQAPARDLIVH